MEFTSILTIQLQQNATLKKEVEEASDRLKENDAYTEEIFGQMQSEQSKHAAQQEELTRLRTRLETEQSAHVATQTKLKEIKDEHATALRSIENSFKELQQQSTKSDDFFFLSSFYQLTIHVF